MSSPSTLPASSSSLAFLPKASSISCGWFWKRRSWYSVNLPAVLRAGGRVGRLQRAAAAHPPVDERDQVVVDLEQPLGLQVVDDVAVVVLEELAGGAAEVLPHGEGGLRLGLARLDGEGVLPGGPGGGDHRARLAGALLAGVGRDHADDGRQAQDADHRRRHDEGPLYACPGSSAARAPRGVVPGPIVSSHRGSHRRSSRSRSAKRSREALACLPARTSTRSGYGTRSDIRGCRRTRVSSGVRLPRARRMSARTASSPAAGPGRPGAASRRPSRR